MRFPPLYDKFLGKYIKKDCSLFSKKTVLFYGTVCSWKIVAFWVTRCYNIRGAFAPGCCHLRRTVVFPAFRAFREKTGRWCACMLLMRSCSVSSWYSVPSFLWSRTIEINNLSKYWKITPSNCTSKAWRSNLSARGATVRRRWQHPGAKAPRIL